MLKKYMQNEDGHQMTGLVDTASQMESAQHADSALLDKLETVYQHWNEEYDTQGVFRLELEGKQLTLLAHWNGNDASLREEYMNPLFKHFGFRVENLPKRYWGLADRLIELCLLPV